jgi:peptide/nickel transport system permease protein
MSDMNISTTGSFVAFRNRHLRNAGRGLAERPATAVALSLILLIALSITAGSALYPHDPNVQHLADRYSGPSFTYPLGTDSLGRDLLARILTGARVSLTAAFLSMALALAIGTPLGLICGYLKGWVDAIVSRMFDALQVIPGLILLVALVGVFGRELSSVVLGLGILYSVKIFRLVRGVTGSISTEIYVQASRAAGGSTFHIVFRHILINALSPLSVQATTLIAWGVLAETGLTYLGLGAQPPAASLGSLLHEGTVAMASSPWLIISPGLFIALVTLSLFKVSDSLRELVGGPNTNAR